METEIKQITKKQAERIALAKRDLRFFTLHYLPHYIQAEVPEFHEDIYAELQKSGGGFTEIIAFRGSAKSTLASLALPLWAAITGQRNFIILCSDTFTQAKQIITNLIYELENNEIIHRDFGTFQSSKDWTATNILLPNGVRIIARSKGQQVRGLRHLEHRPDLIVADDVEGTDDVRQKDQRDKTEEWLLSDVMPSMSDIGRMILIGNLLHMDSIMSRMEKKCREEGLGTVQKYPLLTPDGKCVWPEKFTEAQIDKTRRWKNKYFLREFLLKIIPDEGQVIRRIEHYKVAPKLKSIGIGTDLAISKKETADYSSVGVVGEGIDGNYYNLKSVAGRWDFNETLERVYHVYKAYRDAHSDIPISLGFEDVGYQRAAIEEFTKRYKVAPQSIKRTTDKRARLQTIEPYFASGQVRFREEGDEDLENEIVNFGVEEHDDRMDAFEIALNLLLSRQTPDIDLL